MSSSKNKPRTGPDAQLSGGPASGATAHAAAPYAAAGAGSLHFTPMPRPHIAIFPGSFDPATYGHLDVIRRGRRLFDAIVVAVGRNPGKDQLFSAAERVGVLRTLCAEIVQQEPNDAPVRVESFAGLTVDFARKVNATVLLRGIRNLSDLQNEVQQAVTNREIAGLETAFVVAGQSFAYTSSSLIKQLTAMGNDLTSLGNMVPPIVIEKLREKKAAGHAVLRRLMEEKDGARAFEG